MSYVQNTHHRRCDRDKPIMMFLIMTETSPLNGTAPYDESKKLVRYYQQNIKPSTQFTSFYFFLRSGPIFHRYGNFKIWPWKLMAKVKGNVSGLGHIWNESTNLFALLFVSCKSGHAFLRHRQFIIWPWDFEVKVTAEFKKNWSLNLVAIFMVIVAQTDSKYGINACIGIYFFYFRLYFNIQFTMKNSGD